jgi:hypothetical protein
MRFRVLLPALLLLAPTLAEAEWHIRPFVGLTWGGSTTFVDFEQAAGTVNPALGASGLWLGELIGFEGDFGQMPGFFETGDSNLVERSRVVTMTGNVVLAMPRRLSEYTLRPYFVGGMGAMRVRIENRGDLPTVSTLTTLDIGGGVTGFLTDRVGLNWELRRFWSVAGTDRQQGLSIGPEQLSFWRASMGLAFRY